MMGRFTRTFACQSGAHCGVCREQSPRGEAFRVDKLTVYGEDITTCPHGKPMGWRRRWWHRLAFGPGDAVAWLVMIVTLGIVKPCASCKNWRRRFNAAGWLRWWKLIPEWVSSI